MYNTPKANSNTIFFLSKKAITRITIYFLITLFFTLYAAYLVSYTGITFAATSIPSPPTVSDSPDPATNGQTVTVACSGCSAPADGGSGNATKLFICTDASCTNCRSEMKNAPSNPTFAQVNGYEISPEYTLSEDDRWGHLQVFDNSNLDSGYARWIWDFGAGYTGIFKIKWLAKVSDDNIPSDCVDITYGVYVSNDCASWAAVRTGAFQHDATVSAWNPYTPTYFDTASGTYRCIKAEISSTASCIATAELWVDVVRVDWESTSNCWCSSDYVTSGDPSCDAHICSSCEYSINSYYAMTSGKETFGFDHYVYSSITAESTFTCKKEDTCACGNDVECYNNTCAPSGLCGSYPKITSISSSATLEQLDINWFTEFDRSDSVDVICRLNNDENQECQYSGPTGPGGCTITSPQYDMTPDPSGELRTVQNIVNCTVYYQDDPRFYSETIKTFYPLSFEVSMPSTLSLVVGEKENLVITVKNNGTLSDGYTISVVPANPQLLLIENGEQATELLATHDIQRIYVGVTLLSASESTNANIVVSSNISKDYTEIKYEGTVMIEGMNKNLPDFGFIGIVQIMLTAMVVLVSLWLY